MPKTKKEGRVALKQLCYIRSSNLLANIFVYRMKKLFLYPHFEELLEAGAIVIPWHMTVSSSKLFYSIIIINYTSNILKQVFCFLF